MSARVLCLVPVLATLCGGVLAAGESVLGGGAYGGLTQRHAAGPHYQPVFATHFGSAGHERFVGTGELADGTLVGIGVAWGPDFPAKPAVTVLGSGSHSRGPVPTKENKAKWAMPEPTADMAGFMVFYGPDGKARRSVRMDWGVASITAGMVAGDGKGILAAGRCLAGFASFAARAKAVHRLPFNTQKPEGASKNWKPPTPGGDVWVGRFASDGTPEWVVILERNGDPPDRLFTDHDGDLYFDANGFYKVPPAGGAPRLLVSRTGGGTAHWLGVDPRDGSSFFGGDRNTHTSWEPWRQPFLYKYDPEGKKVQTLWETEPKLVGAGASMMQSDSSPRTLAVSAKGELLITGWSDGGNSILTREPLDFSKRKNTKTGAGFGMSTAGMNAGSVTHMMRIDGSSYELLAHAIWMAYTPMFFGEQRPRGRPNGTQIHQIRALPGGDSAWTGASATGLIQTPNAFWKDPMLPDKHGGSSLSVANEEWNKLLFSSYLPGIDKPMPESTRSGVVVVGHSFGSDNWVKPTDAPSVAADQAFAGASDAWILVLRRP